MVKQVEDMVIKEYCDEDLIFTDRTWSTLEVYDNDVNTHDVTAGVYKNIIIIIVMTQPMKKSPMTKKTAQPINMSLAPTQPMKMAPYTP